MKTLSERDKRALLLLAVAGVFLIPAVWYSYSSDTPAGIVQASAVTSLADAQKRLDKMRQLAAQAPGREEALKKLQEQLAAREKKMLMADTAAQAQAQLLQVLRRVGRTQMPPLEIRGGEFAPVKRLGDDYGEAPVTVAFECRIDQLLNMITELTMQPELSAVEELRIYAANPKEKTVNVRVTVAGVVPRKLVPVRQGAQF